MVWDWISLMCFDICHVDLGDRKISWAYWYLGHVGKGLFFLVQMFKVSFASLIWEETILLFLAQHGHIGLIQIWKLGDLRIQSLCVSVCCLHGSAISPENLEEVGISPYYFENLKLNFVSDTLGVRINLCLRGRLSCWFSNFYLLLLLVCLPLPSLRRVLETLLVSPSWG